MKLIFKKILRKLGFDVIRYNPNASLPDMTEDEKRIIDAARAITLTSIEAMVSLVRAVRYIVKNRIPGDIAECGVWRGGSMMIVAATLLAEGDDSRHLYLYDTFEGMPEPTKIDKDYRGILALEQLRQVPKKTGLWCYANIDEVSSNLLSIGYPEEKIHLIRGKVEDTIPRVVPSALSLLRLDTDWYESTKHGLVHLFPLLKSGGILIIDDYGHWEGSKRAVDEYFEDQKTCIYLSRIDYTVRLAVKVHE
jgi:O-methyltransferase